MTAVESIQVDVSADRTWCSVHFKELSYRDFGSTGHLRPQGVSRMFEAGRLFSLRRGYAYLSDLLSKETSFFVLGLHYTFHPDLWSVRTGHTFPYQIETQLLDFGKTSLTLQSRLVNKLDHKTLGTLDFKYVHVHRKSRHPVPLPDWLVQKYESILKERRPIVFAKDSPQVPMSAYRFELIVTESDTDNNQHTNQGSYVRFCWDATHATVKEGSLPRLQPNISHFPLLKMDAVHTGETLMGDKLQVLLWQQEDCPDTVRYVIKRRTSGEEKVVFHAAMVFGRPSDLSSHL